MTVAVVTDSAADLSASLREREGIAMGPLSVRFGVVTWQDQFDLDASGFWAKLAGAETLPRTAAPSPGAFAEVYRRLRDAGREVVSVHLSGALSATVEAARAGAQMVGEGVSVVDGQSASLGTGLLALWAARAARAGGSRLDTAAALETVAAGQGGEQGPGEPGAALLRAPSHEEEIVGHLAPVHPAAGAVEAQIGDEVLAAAILDRLLHRSNVINIKGRSYRLRDLEAALKNANA